METCKLELKRNLRFTLLFACISGIVLFAFMAIFPSMKDSAMKELVNLKLDSMPAGLLAAFGITSIPDFTQISEYFSYFFQYFVLASVIFATILGVNALGKEEASGTIEYLYAQPVSRSTIYLQKILGVQLLLLLYLVILMSFSALSIWFFAGTSDVTSLLLPIIEIACMSFLVMSAFSGIGFFFNTLLKNPSLTSSITFAILFITYLCGILSRINTNLKDFVYVSLIDYASPLEIVKQGLHINYICILLLMIGGSYGLGWFLYQRKDFSL